MDFQIGDRVRVIRAYQDNTKVVGTEGTVCDLEYHGEAIVSVNHDIYNDFMHGCHGMCKRGHGWNYDLKTADQYLERLAPVPTVSIYNIDELL